MEVQRARNDVITAGTTAVKIASLQNDRVAIYIVNTGTNNVTISKGNGSVVAGQGIVLNSGGGAFSESDQESFKCFRGDIYAITSAGNSTVAISEQWIDRQAKAKEDWQ